jgi:hypothetical protein
MSAEMGRHTLKEIKLDWKYSPQSRTNAFRASLASTGTGGPPIDVGAWFASGAHVKTSEGN